MDHTFEEEIGEQLRQRRTELLGKVAATEEDLETILEDEPLELEEQAQNETIALTLTGLDEHEKREIEEIDGALQRLIDGNYGDCARCGESIGEARLRALPSTPLCVECAQAEEASRPAARTRMI